MTRPLSTIEQIEEAAPITCRDCGISYFDMGLDLVLPDQQWRVIHPGGEGGILCANCICKRAARQHGTAVLAWVNNLEYKQEKAPGGESTRSTPSEDIKVEETGEKQPEEGRAWWLRTNHEGGRVIRTGERVLATREQIEEALKVAESATPGPWMFTWPGGPKVDGDLLIGAVAPGHKLFSAHDGGSCPGMDGEFIAEARTLLPIALKRLRAIDETLGYFAASDDALLPSADRLYGNVLAILRGERDEEEA